MATIQSVTYKIKINRTLPVLKMVMFKGEPGSGGGEPNVIEVIKVNGTTQAVTNKTVNITVPTAISDLDDDSTFLSEDDITGGVAQNNVKLVNGGQVYTAIQNATSTTGGVGSGNTNLVNGGQVYTAIQNAINSITDGDEEAY